MEETLNIYQKLAKVRTIADSAKKSKSGYGYTYADITEILAKVTAGMNKYGLSLLPGIVPGTGKVTQNVVVNTKVDKTGKVYDNTTTEMLFSADMVWTWVDNDNPNSRVEVPWFVTGAQSDPSQALGSGMTYTMRQFLTTYFQIAQTDTDVDAYRSKQKAAAAYEDKMIAGEIISQFDTEVRAYMADHPDKKDEIIKFITKYEKKANYFAITEPKLAAKLLEEFREKFKGE